MTFHENSTKNIELQKCIFFLEKQSYVAIDAIYICRTFINYTDKFLDVIPDIKTRPKFPWQIFELCIISCLQAGEIVGK